MTLKIGQVTQERKKDDWDVATNVIMVLLHFLLGPSLFVIPKWTLQELEDPRQLLPPF